MGTNATGHVGRIRLSDGQIESIDLSPSNMAELTMDESGDYVYICGGTWPPIGEGVSQEHFNNYIGTGRIFEVRTSDFTLNRTLALGIDNTGISYQNGKLVVMSCEMQRFESPATGKLMCGNTCIVVDVEDFQIEHELAVGLGDMNMSFAIPDSDYVMLGYNVDRADGVGFALINVLTGDLEQAYVTDPNYNNENRNPEGGGLEMAFDLENNKLYATLYIAREAGQTQYRVGVIDMTTNEYVDWLVEPFRYYRDILFDPISGNLYLTAPLDDAIVVLEPPQ
jgi:hypothetical protein